MQEQLAKILIKLDQLDQRITALEKKHKSSFTPTLRHSLVSNAVEQIINLPQVSTVYFQQTFSLGKKESTQLFDELEKNGIVKTIEVNTDDPTHPYKVGKVSKYKAKKYLQYF